MSSYEPAAIANSFLDFGAADERALSHMQVQKLVYFAHGWHLAMEQGPLSNELPQAWLYGPVFPSLYHQLKRWGGRHIRERIRTPDVISSGISKSIIQRTWVDCRDLTAIQLSDRSHDPRGPWYRLRIETGEDRDVDISNELIYEYFGRLKDAYSAASR